MAFVVAASLASPLFGQRDRELIQLQADVVRLSQQVDKLQVSLDEKTGAVRSLVEKLYDQMAALAQTLQGINANVDAVKASGEKSASETRNQVAGLVTGLQAMGEGLTAARSQLAALSQQIASVKTTAEPLETADTVWRSAQTDFFVGNYDLAIAGYRDFLTKFSDDLRNADAQLSLGNAYYNQKKFEQAIIEYDLLLQKFPKGDKRADALLKKGLSLAELNQTQQAITNLERVVTEFPRTTAAESAASRIRELRTVRKR